MCSGSTANRASKSACIPFFECVQTGRVGVGNKGWEMKARSPAWYCAPVHGRFGDSCCQGFKLYYLIVHIDVWDSIFEYTHYFRLLAPFAAGTAHLSTHLQHRQFTLIHTIGLV